jgi:glycerophosphoryl diester phosphodiesterase
VEDQAEPTPDGPSRRAVIGGAVAALLAVAVPTAVVVSRRDSRSAVQRMLDQHPFVVAHRGGDADRPEMSLAAYQHAVDRGVDGVEISLGRTSDGVWFGLHDTTLDRTSGTQGFVASEHTWAEVKARRISAAHAGDHHGPAQPYMSLEQLVASVGDSVAIFVDPKAVAREHHGGLLRFMDAAVPDPTGTFVAKSYYLDRGWAKQARARGYRTWGYYYGRDIERSPGVLSGTQANWDMLGLDVNAPTSAWDTARSFHKPVIAHVVRTRAQARTALDRGAQGLMVSHLAAAGR